MIEGGLSPTGEAAITVTNRGIPILRGEEDKIFDLWYRSKAAVRLRPSGAGIGLTIARDIVRSHGGELSLRHSTKLPESQSYKTTFVITLPFWGD